MAEDGNTERERTLAKHAASFLRGCIVGSSVDQLDAAGLLLCHRPGGCSFFNFGVFVGTQIGKHPMCTLWNAHG